MRPFCVASHNRSGIPYLLWQTRTNDSTSLFLSSGVGYLSWTRPHHDACHVSSSKILPSGRDSINITLLIKSLLTLHQALICLTMDWVYCPPPFALITHNSAFPFLLHPVPNAVARKRHMPDYLLIIYDISIASPFVKSRSTAPESPMNRFSKSETNCKEN